MAVITLAGRQIRIDGRLVRTARLAAEKFEFLDHPESALDALRHSGMPVDLFTFLQRLPDTSPKYPYPMEWDNLAALRIASYDVWWTKQIDNKTRNMVRRAEKKGIAVREVPFDDALVEGIREIYNESPVRQGKLFPHYGKDISTVCREEMTFLDRSVFVGAFLGSELVAFAKLTADETWTQAGLMNIVAMIRHRDKAPANALVAQSVRSCAARQIAYLTYSNFAYGNKERDTLADFKSNNGFQRVNLPRYFVPLTRRGAAAFALGLHRKFADHVPAPLLAAFRECRNAWYQRRFQSGLGVR
jgi:hypothetical protein